MKKKGWLKEMSFYEEEGLTYREEFLWRRRADLQRRDFMKKKGWLTEKSFYEEEGLT